MVNYARHIRPAFERLWSTAKHWALQAAGRAWFCSDYLCWTVRGRCWLATVVGAFVLHVQRVRRGISTNQSSREQNEYEIVGTFDWLPKQLNGQLCPWGCSEEIDISIVCIYVIFSVYICKEKFQFTLCKPAKLSAPKSRQHILSHKKAANTISSAHRQLIKRSLKTNTTTIKSVTSSRARAHHIYGRHST